MREPRCELAARHALVWFLNDCGLGWEALDLLGRTRPLYFLCRESQPRLTLPWLEARICRGLGRLDAAERGLAAVWHGEARGRHRPRALLVAGDGGSRHSGGVSELTLIPAADHPQDGDHLAQRRIGFAVHTGSRYRNAWSRNLVPGEPGAGQVAAAGSFTVKETPS